MIWFIRHGVTDWNEFVNDKGEHDPKMQGSVDIPLNSRGIAQAQELAKELEGKHFDMVFCSPLQRAKLTCEIAYKGDTEIVFDDRLKERCFGEFEGRLKSELDFGLFWDEKLNAKFERAECVVDFNNRVISFLEELKPYKDQEILIVAHGGVGRAIRDYYESRANLESQAGVIVENAKPMIFDFNKIWK